MNQIQPRHYLEYEITNRPQYNQLCHFQHRCNNNNCKYTHINFINLPDIFTNNSIIKQQQQNATLKQNNLLLLSVEESVQQHHHASKTDIENKQQNNNQNIKPPSPHLPEISTNITQHQQEPLLLKLSQQLQPINDKLEQQQEAITNIQKTQQHGNTIKYIKTLSKKLEKRFNVMHEKLETLNINVIDENINDNVDTEPDTKSEIEPETPHDNDIINTINDNIKNPNHSDINDTQTDLTRLFEFSS